MTPRTHALDVPAQALLDAVIAMSGDLDLTSTLHRITRSACELTGARYGALGVIGPDGRLGELITHGISATVADHIAEQAVGRGVLRQVIDEAAPVRVDDLAAHPAAYGFPDGHPAMHSFLGVPVRVRGQIFGNLYLTEKNGGEPFTDLDEQLVSALATAAGSMIDNARAFGLSERRRRWLEAAAALTEALEPPLDDETALHRICQTVCGLTGARAVAIVTHDGLGPTAAFTSTPADEELALHAALVLQSEAPAELGPVREQVAEGLCALLVPFRSALSGRGRICVLHDETPGVGSDEDAFLVHFAEQAALALDRVHAVETRADLAVVTDRERIARELHDVVIQRLFATGLQLQALGRVATEPALQERLSAAVDALDLTVRDIRTTIFALQHPETA